MPQGTFSVYKLLPYRFPIMTVQLEYFIVSVCSIKVIEQSFSNELLTL